MDGLRSAGLLICILMMLMAYLKEAIPKGRSAYLMKAIISVFILLSIVNGIRNISWKSLEDLLNRSYDKNEAVWDQVSVGMAEGLKKEFQRFLDEEKIDAEVLSVEIKVEGESFSVGRVTVDGYEVELAGKLLASRYGINLEMIEVADG